MGLAAQSVAPPLSYLENELPRLHEGTGNANLVFKRES
jgi:hypothetical protein